MKPLEAEDLTTKLVTRWVAGKKVVDSIDRILQYPLNRLNTAVGEGKARRDLNSVPSSIVAQAGGNHLDIIVRYIDDMELIKETADAFRSIGGYCLGRQLKGSSVHERQYVSGRTSRRMVNFYLGTDSHYFLVRYNCVSEHADIFNRDGQGCLHDVFFFARVALDQ